MLDISCAAGYPDDREDVGSIMVWIRRLQPFGSPDEQRHFFGGAHLPPVFIPYS